MKVRIFPVLLTVVGLAACAPAAPPAEEVLSEEPAAEEEAAEAGDEAVEEMPDINLDNVKAYTVEHGEQMEVYAAQLEEEAATYYGIIEGAGFDYEAAWEASGSDLASLMTDMRGMWLNASTHYELDEGIVAGVPELADYDAWIDAGPPASEAPDEAYVWTLELPNGETLESPGNIFHTLLEPTLYGTNPDFVGAAVDLNGDGTVGFTEVLPEANMLYGSAQALHTAAGEMNGAITAWEPTVEDAFTALVVMTPTMSEYFEQWKLSAAIAGEETDEEAFIATSRLFDVAGILNGLGLTYDNLSVMVAAADPALDEQILAGYQDLTSYVNDLYEAEQSGTRYAAEEADALGTEAQAKAQALSALVAQAAQETNTELLVD